VPIAWVDVSDKPATFPPTVPIPWTDVSDKPATFPPILPIAQSDVTNLVSDLGAKEVTANRAVANGYASLDAGAKVPATQLPSYVDDVQEFANLAALPGTGTAGIIYVTLDTNKTYRWSGSAYIEISPSPGSTDAVSEGSVNLYHTTGRAAAAAPVQSVASKTGAVTLVKADVGLSNVDDTTDANKPISTATQTALDGKLNASKLTVGTSAPSSPSVNDVWIDTT
jgi:hypothetical protein